MGHGVGKKRKRYRVQVTRTYWASGCLSSVGTVDVEASGPRCAEKAALNSEYDIDNDLDGSMKDEVTKVELTHWQCACGAWNVDVFNDCMECDRRRPKSLMK